MAKQSKKKRPLTAIDQVRKIDQVPISIGLNAAIDAYRSFSGDIGVFFDLDLELFKKITAQNCAICKAPPAIKLTTRHYRNGIMRKNKSEGFVNQNVQACCLKCLKKYGEN